MPGSHTGQREDGSDGATTTLESGSPVQHGAHSTHFTTPGLNNPNVYNQRYLFPHRPLQPDYAKLLPDNDTRDVVPQPLSSFIVRLRRGAFQTTNSSFLSMKSISNFSKYFKHTYSGARNESWAQHLDHIETEVFERENFYPKQCYYALRGTLTLDAMQTIQLIERGLETPRWRTCIPPWYKPSNEDLTNMLHSRPFAFFTYSLKLALIVVYFHHKFSQGSAKTA